jgi:DNA replication protein DnaC
MVWRSAWGEWQAEYAIQQKPVMPEVWLDRLIEAEQVDRQARSLSYQLKAARFPLNRDLMGFDWQESPLQRTRIEQLANAGFMDQAYNLILVGGTGTGKTHLATALAMPPSIRANACVSSTPLTSSINWIKKNSRVRRETWPSNWQPWMQ